MSRLRTERNERSEVAGVRTDKKGGGRSRRPSGDGTVSYFGCGTMRR